jgi:hypothetical protein
MLGGLRLGREMSGFGMVQSGFAHLGKQVPLMAGKAENDRPHSRSAVIVGHIVRTIADHFGDDDGFRACRDSLLGIGDEKGALPLGDLG